MINGKDEGIIDVEWEEVELGFFRRYVFNGGYVSGG